MWRCPYCFSEMLATSRPGHLKNKQGCSEQHALFLAAEAKKKEEAKERNMAFFRPRAPASASAETAVVPPTAPKSTGVTLDKQGAQNSNLGSFSGLLESMVQYYWSSSLLQNPATASTKEQEGASKNQAGPNHQMEKTS